MLSFINAYKEFCKMLTSMIYDLVSHFEMRIYYFEWLMHKGSEMYRTKSTADYLFGTPHKIWVWSR